MFQTGDLVRSIRGYGVGLVGTVVAGATTYYTPDPHVNVQFDGRTHTSRKLIKNLVLVLKFDPDLALSEGL